MPSNTMKISQLIAHLQDELATHGDIDCILQVTALGGPVALDGRNIQCEIELPTGQRLRQPALVFGLWRGAPGQPVTSNTPGQAYQVTHDGRDDWNYNRNEAPDKTPLVVWKRYQGEDRGFRDGEKWFVYEGGPKPIEIIPTGVLGWRLEIQQ